MDLKHLHVCIDRRLPSYRLAHHLRETLAVNPRNLPEKIGFGAYEPAYMAFLVGKVWLPATALSVKFLDGDAWVQDKVFETAKRWEEYGNFTFERVKSGPADIRISFEDNGSWSYVGTESRSVPLSSPTMNFGWLTRQTPTKEYHRVVLHEFGHALGCIHEHQSPAAGALPWKREAVYELFGASPNFWSKEEVDRNIFDRYSRTETNFTELDLGSIMMYQFPPELFSKPFETPGNDELSELDKQFMRENYPRSSARAPMPRSEGALVEEIRRLDLLHMDPIEAFGALKRIKDLAEVGGVPELDRINHGTHAAAAARR